MVNTIYLFGFVETPRKFIIASIIYSINFVFLGARLEDRSVRSECMGSMAGDVVITIKNLKVEKHLKFSILGLFALD